MEKSARAIYSLNHGTIACLVATFSCWVGLSGAKLIRKIFLLAISDYGQSLWLS